MHKGATAFIDSVDETWYVSKSFIQKGNSKTSSIDLEPQNIGLIQSYKRQSQTLRHTLFFFRDDIRIGLTQKQYNALELAKEIINANTNDIIQSKLAKQIVKLANINHCEIVGKNALWNLLAELNDKLFSIELSYQKDAVSIRKLYKPLLNGTASITKDSKTLKKSETKASNTLSLSKQSLQILSEIKREAKIRAEVLEILQDLRDSKKGLNHETKQIF